MTQLSGKSILCVNKIVLDADSMLCNSALEIRVRRGWASGHEEVHDMLLSRYGSGDMLCSIACYVACTVAFACSVALLWPSSFVRISCVGACVSKLLADPAAVPGAIGSATDTAFFHSLWVRQ